MQGNAIINYYQSTNIYPSKSSSTYQFHISKFKQGLIGMKPAILNYKASISLSEEAFSRIKGLSSSLTTKIKDNGSAFRSYLLNKFMRKNMEIP